jgi:hypothetical protein
MTFEAVPLGQHPTKITPTAHFSRLGRVITKTLLMKEGRERAKAQGKHMGRKGRDEKEAATLRPFECTLISIIIYSKP